MPLILGTNSIKDTGFEVANSCRWNDGDSPYMTKDNGSSGSTTKSTVSFWIKRGTLGTAQDIWESYNDGSNFFRIRFTSGDLMELKSDISNSNILQKITSRVFRDVSAWMHVCIIIDLSNGTAEDKVQLYINGTRETSFGTNTNTSTTSGDWVGGSADFDFTIGRHPSDDAYLDGYIAEFCFVDNDNLAATNFGEFDEDSPTIWKPIDVSGLTFGTNGFYLDFEDSANLGNDANGGTDFTENNLAATDQAIDTPTNSFCTFNPLYFRPGRTATTFSQGNCKSIHSDSGGTTPAWGTIMLNHGKWYFEMKVLIVNYSYIGVWQTQGAWTNPGLYDGLSGVNTYRGADGSTNDENVGIASYGTSQSANDIVGCAFDCDTGTIWFSKNGTWQNSATQAEVVAGTTTNAAFTGKAYSTNGVVPIITGYSGASIEANFGGCSAFAVSSGNADDNGYGNFEYDVPTGYYAICTKNLAEFGG
jgi:hypothetical protein